MTSSVIAEIDALYDDGFARNDEPDGTEQLKRCLDLCLNTLKETSNDYEVLWRTSRAAGEYAESLKGRDVPGWKDACKEWGKRGMDYAEKAKRLHPERVEAWFWQCENLGQYADATSLMTALKENFKGMMEENLHQSYRIDKTYLDWSPTFGYAMFYNSLPLIAGGNKKKAMEYYNEYRHNGDYGFEGHIRRLHAAEFLLGFKDKRNKPEILRLVTEAKALNGKRPYYMAWARRIESQLR